VKFRTARYKAIGTSATDAGARSKDDPIIFGTGWGCETSLQKDGAAGPLLPSFLRRKVAVPQKGGPRPIVGAKKAPNPQDRIIYSNVAMPLPASPLQPGHRTDSTSAPDVRLAIGRPHRRGINGRGLFRQKAIARWGKQPQRQTRNRQHCQDFYGDVHLPI
jgi:hypothetical protein